MNNISFPGFGIDFNLQNYIQIFGFKLYWYAVIITAGLILAFIYALKNCARFNIKEDDIFDGIIFGVPSAIIGARLFYVIFDITSGNGSNYKSFLDYINIRNGGLAIWGAIIAVVIMIFIFCHVKKIKAGSLLDLTSIGLLIGQGIGRWGNFVNGEVYGVETDLPWRMGVNGVFAHPLFLYESIWDLGGFVLLHFFSKSKYKKFDGEVFLGYLAWYGLGRGFLEGLRTEEYVLKIGSFPISQALGFLFAAAAVIAIFVIRKKLKDIEIDAAEGYTPAFDYIPAAEETINSDNTENETISDNNTTKVTDSSDESKKDPDSVFDSEEEDKTVLNNNESEGSDK